MSDSSYSTSAAESDSDSDFYGGFRDISPPSSRKSPSHAQRYPYIQSIVDTINSLGIPGSFASGGQFQFPLPALKIYGVEGYVGFPVCNCQAKAMIAVCAQAPFGRGQDE